jgi:hypothetical protein
MSSIPEEFYMVQRLVDRLGPAATLRLLSAECGARAQGAQASQWSQIAQWIMTCAENVRGIEPPRPPDDGETGGAR